MENKKGRQDKKGGIRKKNDGDGRKRKEEKEGRRNRKITEKNGNRVQGRKRKLKEN